MDVRSIKQIAEEQNVSYEAIRRQVARYSDELKDHIIRRNRTQFIDDWGYQFLKEKRRESPIILMNMDQNEQIEELKAQVDMLTSKLLAAQEQIISLQGEANAALEDRIRCKLLLEDNKAKEQKLQEADNQIRTMQTERETDRLTIQTIRLEADGLRKTADDLNEETESLRKTSDALKEEAEGLRKETDALRQKAEDDRRTIEDLQRQRDDAQAEAQSFTRSLFGFYRKR